MTLVRFNPLSLMRDFDRFFDTRQFGSVLDDAEGADWLPRVDVSDGDDMVVVKAEIPGVDPKDIDITLDGDLLTIKGAKSMTTEEEENGFRRREIFEGSFRRSIRIPFAADPAAVTASATHGIVEIKVPRADKPETHKISVNVD